MAPRRPMKRENEFGTARGLDLRVERQGRRHPHQDTTTLSIETGSAADIAAFGVASTIHVANAT
jgi:hypothetical protein